MKSKTAAEQNRLPQRLFLLAVVLSVLTASDAQGDICGHRSQVLTSMAAAKIR